MCNLDQANIIDKPTALVVGAVKVIEHALPTGIRPTIPILDIAGKYQSSLAPLDRHTQRNHIREIAQRSTSVEPGSGSLRQRPPTTVLLDQSTHSFSRSHRIVRGRSECMHGIS